MKTSTKHRLVSLSTFFAILLSATLFLSSCKSAPQELPLDITEAELLQMGQSAIDDNNPEAAKYYYNAVLAIFGSNMASVVVAEFELAHIDIKNKKYADAKPLLERIISYYEDPELAPTLPPEYKTLAEIDLAKVE